MQIHITRLCAVRRAARVLRRRLIRQRDLPCRVHREIYTRGDGHKAAWDTTSGRTAEVSTSLMVVALRRGGGLTQEIFLKVFRSLGTFDQRANFQTWLISVSRNFCIDRYRSGRRDREVFAREVDASTVQAEAPGLNPYARVELQDRVALLRDALRSLSPPLRAAVLLRDIHELSYQEIAAQLALPKAP